MEGFIKLHRRILQWEWYDDSHMVHLFLHLVLRANYKDGSWRGVTVKRGQFITSVDKLSKATGISTRSIRTCLERLEKTEEIAKETTKHFTIITVCKYEDYNDKEIATDKQPTIERQTTDKQPTTSKNNKNNKNIIDIDKSISNAGLPTSTPPLSIAERVRNFVQVFNLEKEKASGTKGKYTDTKKVVGAFKTRVKKYSAPEILKAVRAAFKHDYHIESNFCYLTPEYILRENILDRYINMADMPVVEKSAGEQLTYVAPQKKISHG